MTGPGVAFMTYVPELKLIYYADKGSNILKVYTFDCKPYTRLGGGARYSPPAVLHDGQLSFLLMFFKCFLTFVVVYLVVVFQLVEEDLCVPRFDLLRRR